MWGSHIPKVEENCCHKITNLAIKADVSKLSTTPATITETKK